MMMDDKDMEARLRVSRAIVVEGRDDVAAVSRAADALIIPTHGFGITKETWDVIAKADAEKGLMILTDPDHAGEQIRRMLTERFPGAAQAYIARDDATDADDIGVENASPEVIREALTKAMSRGSIMAAGTEPQARRGHLSFAETLSPRGPLRAAAKDRPAGTEPQAARGNDMTGVGAFAAMSDLRSLGLAGCEGAAERRAAVCKGLGIGYGNAAAVIKKLRGFGIGLDELRKEVENIGKEQKTQLR